MRENVLTLKEFIVKEGFEEYLVNNTYLKDLCNIWNADSFNLISIDDKSCCIRLQDTTYCISCNHSLKTGFSAQIIVKRNNDENTGCSDNTPNIIPEVIEWIAIIMKTRYMCIQAVKNERKSSPVRYHN